MNLLHRNGIQPSLNEAKHSRESPRRVDDVQLAKTLWVVVLGDARGALDVAVSLGGLGKANAFEIEDGAAGLNQVAGLAGAGWEARVGELLVFDGEVLEHAVFGGECVHGW